VDRQGLPTSLSTHWWAAAHRRVRISREERRAWLRQVAALRERIAGFIRPRRSRMSHDAPASMVRRLRRRRDAHRRTHLMTGLTHSSQLLLGGMNGLLDRCRRTGPRSSDE
jgi:hypothetical protein